MMTLYKAAAITFFIFNIASIKFAQAQWEPDYRLTNNDSISFTNINNAWCIANGEYNDAHVVWYDKRSGNCAIYYKRSLDNGLTWSSDTRLSFMSDSSVYPAVAVAESIVHVVWIDATTNFVYYERSLDHGATWCPETAMGLYVPINNNACIAAYGRFVSIAWTSGSNQVGCICSQDCGSTWLNEVHLNALDFPSVARRDMEVHIVRNSPNRYWLLYNRSTDNGTTWSPEDTISNGSDIRTPSIVASDSIIHVVWRDYQGGWTTKYARSTDGGSTWSAAAVLGQGIYPSITCKDSSVYVIWDGNGSVGLLYRWSSDFGVTWSAETLLTTPLGGNFPYPSIDCTDSLVNIVWRDARDGNSEIYYKRYQKEGIGCDEDKVPSYRPLIFSAVQTILGNTVQIRCNTIIAGTTRLALLNTYGSRIWGKNIQCSGQTIRIDGNEIAGLPKGVYFLSLEAGNNTFHIFKVVKF